MDINIITAIITGFIAGGFAIAGTVITLKMRARTESKARVWQQIEWALDKALEGKTPEAREAGRRAAENIALRSDSKEVALLVKAALGEPKSKLIVK